jgi:hypothetical protein
VVGLAEYGAHRMALGAASTSARKIKIGGAGFEGLIQRLKFHLQDFW